MPLKSVLGEIDANIDTKAGKQRQSDKSTGTSCIRTDSIELIELSSSQSKQVGQRSPSSCICDMALIYLCNSTSSFSVGRSSGKGDLDHTVTHGPSASRRKRPVSALPSPYRSRYPLKAPRQISPSPSPQPASRLGSSLNSDSSLARFSPSASYARLSPSKVHWPPSPTRSPKSGATAPDEPSDLSVELGSFTGADDGHGQGKVDMAVQVGSPARLFQGASRIRNAHPPAVNGSQTNKQGLESRGSPAGLDLFSPVNVIDSSDMAHGRELPMRLKRMNDSAVFASLPPRLLLPSARALSTSTQEHHSPVMSRSDLDDMLQAANEPEADSSVEILDDPRDAKPASPGDQNIDPAAKKSVQAASTAASTKPGWFTRPAAAAGTKTSTSNPTNVRASAPTAREGTQRYSNQVKAYRKQNINDDLRARYPIDFDWSRWGRTRPKLVYTNQESEVDRVLNTLTG